MTKSELRDHRMDFKIVYLIFEFHISKFTSQRRETFEISNLN